jgi:hypothetical protein
MVLATVTQGLGAWVPALAGVVPVLVIAAWSWWDRERRNQLTRAPQVEKLLRPPGHSLAIKLDDLADRAIYKSLFAFGLCGFAGTILAVSAQVPGLRAIPFLLTGLALAGGGAYATVLAVRDMSKSQKLRLGLRGEQAVAEALQEVADCGYRAFHDLSGAENWNIDHVIVGLPGVFLIESKARNRVRPRRAQQQPSHVVYVVGDTLRFPSGQDMKAIPQAERNSIWLAEYLTKKTGEKVEVEALVVPPGWFIEIKQPPTSGTMVMNAKYMVQYLRGRPARLSEAQVRRIIAQLDEKCRDVEF